ncbi:hypothetical protein PAXRUDRAFT_169831, partial [Paxillus rubicundulus Ve08.2h10]
KLVLCLKEPSLYKWKDDKDNQDLDNEKTRDQSGMSKEKEDKDVETLRRKLANITLSLPMMVKYNNTTAGGVPSPAVNVEATPITLCGIHNDPVVSRKCNRFESFSDNTEWPPHCPRPFKDVPMNLPIKALEMFKTLSEPVEAVGKENAVSLYLATSPVFEASDLYKYNIANQLYYIVSPRGITSISSLSSLATKNLPRNVTSFPGCSNINSLSVPGCCVIHTT